MKKMLNIINVFICSFLTVLPVNACNFFGDNSHSSHALYKYEESFNGTSYEYEGNIVNNIKIESWKKYANDWQSFINKYKLLKFSDTSFIKIETPNYINDPTRNFKYPNEITGPDLRISTQSIVSSINKNDSRKQIWKMSFMYYFGSWYSPLVYINMLSHSFIWYSDNGNIYLTEKSKNAVEGARFKIFINDVFL